MTDKRLRQPSVHPFLPCLPACMHTHTQVMHTHMHKYASIQKESERERERERARERERERERERGVGVMPGGPDRALCPGDRERERERARERRERDSQWNEADSFGRWIRLLSAAKL